jgi:hypothetical protein
VRCRQAVRGAGWCNELVGAVLQSRHTWIRYWHQ